MRRDVYRAQAGPKIRAIVDILAYRELTPDGLAENFEIRQPAITRHIKFLTETGLVFTRQQGRECCCAVRLNKLDEASTWADRYRKFFEASMVAQEGCLSKL